MYLTAYVFAFTVFFVQAVYANTPITFTERDKLSFGAFMVDNTSSTLEVRPNGAIIINGGIILQGGTSNARFRVQGEPNTSVLYSLSTGDFLNGPGQPLALTGLRGNRGGVSGSFSLNNRGRRHIKIGGTLNINPSQIGGFFSGVYTLFVDYQ